MSIVFDKFRQKVAETAILLLVGIAVFALPSVIAHAANGNFDASGVSDGKVLYKGASADNYGIQALGGIAFSDTVQYYAKDIYRLAQEASKTVYKSEGLLENTSVLEEITGSGWN